MESLLHATAIFMFGGPAGILAFLASRRFGVMGGLLLVVIGKLAQDWLVGLNLGFGVRSAAMGAEIGLLIGWATYWAWKTASFDMCSSYYEVLSLSHCPIGRSSWRMGSGGECAQKNCSRWACGGGREAPWQFHADRPNQLWVSDFTYVSTWQGWLYVAFVIDVFARRIVGWRVSTRMKTGFVLDALEQALYARQPHRTGGLIHHSDRGRQYVAIRYTERLAEAGIEPSVGSKGDSYDNALAETINGLYKTELIYRQSWKSREAVEMATPDWVHWYNHQRLLSSIGYIPPTEAEANFHQQQAGQAMAA